MRKMITCKECKHLNINKCGHGSADAAYLVRNGSPAPAPELDMTEGAPEWCPYLIERKVYRVSENVADQIMKHGKPIGAFYFYTGSLFVGIFNRTGDVQTKEFNCKSDCIKWLKG